MVIIFLGPPGSGKGTQGKLVSKLIGYKHISTGDMLREYAEKDDDIARKLKETLGSGKLVSDELINEILKNYLKDLDLFSNMILDGYPRTVDQAKFLSNLIGDKVLAIHFKIDEDILIKRIEGRFVCLECGAIYNEYFNNTKIESVCDFCGSTEFKKRSDDRREILEKRLEEYNKETSRLIAYFQENNQLKEVDSSSSSEVITDNILLVIKNY